jgi:hypothetical protein
MQGTSIFGRMAAAASQPSQATKDVVQNLVGKEPIFSPEGGMVDGVLYWLKKRAAGEEEEGLTQMALDILSCPGAFLSLLFIIFALGGAGRDWELMYGIAATSVDVERTFSAGGDYVAKKRHSLSARSVCRGMAVGFYSKNDMVPVGLLRKGRKDRASAAKMAKSKPTRKAGNSTSSSKK